MLSKEEKRDFYDNTVTYSTSNKSGNVRNIIDSILNKTLTMFLYNNLPNTLPIEELEKILQLNGYGFITMINDELVALKGTYNYDKVDIYNRPSQINCYLPNEKKQKLFNISEGVIIKNDYLERGLLPIFQKWGYLINESETTLTIANKYKRMVKTFIANDDATVESVKTYLSKVDGGESSVITSNMLWDSVKIDSETNTNTLHELIEYDNYIKSELYEEIGLYSNDNMKKERLITSEVESGINSIFPLVDNMLNCRKQAINEINNKFNTDISVEFTSSWDYRLNLGENLTEETVDDMSKEDEDVTESDE